MARHIKNITNGEGKMTPKETSFDVYEGMVENHPEGIVVSEVEKRMVILRKIREAKDLLVLEEPEWTVLDRALATQKWVRSSQFIVDLCKAVADAEEKDAK